jgi:TonB-dependent starch-binding outer membrane protein SusC
MRKHRQFLTGILLLVTIGLHAQVQQITGKVTDATGSPIPAATIKIKGARGGTSADVNGAFSLKAPVGAELIISGIGFEPKEVKVGSSAVVAVQLSADSKSLSEVVVTGVGVATSKKKLGIAVESVTADQLPPTPTASIDQALIGKIPGAQISSTSGNPGDPVNIVLRGINTLQNGTKPLIMVDGVQVSATDMNSLDLTNVDRVEVVQGAASASLYGAQGANGVIQIFTKKGHKGPVAINLFSSTAENSYINSGHVHKANLHSWLTDANNNIVSYGSGTPLTYDQYGSIDSLSYEFGGPTRYAILDIQNIDNKPYNENLKYYDHFKEVFQSGYTLNNGVSISDANDHSDYNISVTNNHTLSPVMKNGYLDRSNLTANLGTEIFKGFRIRSITQLIYTRNTIVPGLGGPGGYQYGKGNSLGNVGQIFSSLNTSPFFDLKYKLADGTSPAYQSGGFVSINAFNPYYQKEYASGVDNKIDVVQNFDADYKINKFVELDAKYGINYRTENARWVYQNQSNNINSDYYQDWAGWFNGADNGGEIDNWQYNTTFQNFIASAYFKTDFQNDFHSKLPLQTVTQVAFDYRKNLYKEYDTYGLDVPFSPPINLQSTSTQAVYYDYVEPFITYGYLVDQRVDIGDFAGVSGGVRADYSSAFGGGSKAFVFPHINGYFLPSALPFWSDGSLGKALSTFKVRAAFGEAGIQPGPFDRYPTFNQQNLGTSLIYTFPTEQQNPGLNVEVSKEFEAGTDFTIPANKGGSWFTAINGSFTYWHRTSDNVIYPTNVALSSGFTSSLNNAISLHSEGEEFQLNIPVVTSKKFYWNFTTNFGHQLSMIDKVAGGVSIPVGPVDGNNIYIYLTPGYRIGQLYGYKALTSLNETYQDGKTPYIPAGDQSQYTMVNGRVVSLSTYQIQFTSEKFSLGNTDPKFNSSFINEFGYKGFLTLSFQFDWIYGAHIYNVTKEWMYRDGISGDYTKKVNIDGNVGAYTAYWSSPYYNLFGSTHGSGNEQTKDFFLEPASFLRLRNAAVGFDFARLWKIRYFKRLQLVVSGRNLWTKTKYTGFDPEISSVNPNSSYTRGIDNSTIPNLKSFQAGLNVGF